MDEWRLESRLLRLAIERPHHFYKDSDGTWHFLPAEKEFAKLGIQHRLRSADEHPRIFLANLSFLSDYSLENVPTVPEEEIKRLHNLFKERPYIPHLELVHQQGFTEPRGSDHP